MAKKLDQTPGQTQQDTLGDVQAAPPELAVIPGLWIAKGGGYELKVEADSRSDALSLFRAYTDLEEHRIVLAQAKHKPAIGERVLRGVVSQAVVDGVTVPRIEYQLS